MKTIHIERTTLGYGYLTREHEAAGKSLIDQCCPVALAQHNRLKTRLATLNDVVDMIEPALNANMIVEIKDVKT